MRLRQTLLECPGYTHRLFVTIIPYAAEVMTCVYAGRADSENRIKELKEDLSLNTFWLLSFDATDNAVRTGGVLYNLLMGFRRRCSRRVGSSSGYMQSGIGCSWSGPI